MKKATARRLRSIAIAVCILTTLGISFWVHRLAGLTLPYPNDDENFFLLPAINLAQYNTLLTPELNPYRHLLWMPPGYAMLFGVLFKIVPFSLPIARDVSWFFSVLFFLGMCFLLLRQDFAFVTVGTLSMFFLSTSFIAAGNVARMETVVLAIVVWGFFLFSREQYLKSLSLLSLSPIVHPNGVYFLVAALLSLIVGRRLAALRIRNRTDALSLAGALMLILSYAIYVAFHWQEFLTDIGFQFSRKLSNDHMVFLTSNPQLLVLMVLYGLIGLANLINRRGLSSLFLLGFCSLCVITVGQIMWYRVYESLSVAVAIILVLELIEPAAHRNVKSRGIRHGLILGLAFVLIIPAYLQGYVSGPIGYPYDLGWNGAMPKDEETKYVSQAEMDQVTEVLNGFAGSGRTLRILFDPRADGLLFFPRKDRRFTHFHPLFCEMEPDVVVIHTSSYLPWWHVKWQEVHTIQWGIDSSTFSTTDSTSVVAGRNANDRWFIKRIRN